MNLQVVCDLAGDLLWVSYPVDGRAHDVRAVRESGPAEHLDPNRVLRDKRYVGLGMLTPIKKPAGGQLLDWQKEINRNVNQIRYVVERATTNLKI